MFMGTVYTVYTKLPRLSKRSGIVAHTVRFNDEDINDDMSLLLDVCSGRYEYDERSTLVDYNETLYYLEEFCVEQKRVNSLQARLVGIMNKSSLQVIHELAEGVRDLISQGALVEARPLL